MQAALDVVVSTNTVVQPDMGLEWQCRCYWISL